MKLLLPYYYRNFKCSAEKCSDNCCIGWDICIDDKTAELYSETKGEFGERLRKNIDFDENCFINNSENRCPFLNEKNLCDIIINLGEDCLCEICDRHPRYFEWFDNEIEGGIGMCCEEAAKLILSAEDFGMYETEAPHSLIAETEEYDEQFFDFLKITRNKIKQYILNDEDSLDVKLGRIIKYSEILQNCADEYEIFEIPEIPSEECSFDTVSATGILTEMEFLDKADEEYFTGLFKYAEEIRDTECEDEKELKNIFVYFLMRYYMKSVYSGYIYPKLMLCVFAVKIMSLIFSYEKSENGRIDFTEKCRTAKNFSKLAEYNEENLELIYSLYEY